MPRLVLLLFFFFLSACWKDSAPDVKPYPDRFTKVVFLDNLYEPMELDLLDDGRILFVQRRGEVMLYDPDTQQVHRVARLDVFMEFEEGLIGVAVDPDYANNHWVYFVYSAPAEAVIRVARFELRGMNLARDTEKILLEVPVQREQCCHVGGSLEFGHDGNLFLSIGDNTNPFASDGFAPIDMREDRKAWDAQGSSANTQDLRGKILRIRPEPDGSYSIPDGNLFPRDGSLGRPEIYVMGNRNPFRISVDARTGYLYWGEVGPDAGQDSTLRGPKGHDEVNQARQAGNFGWPYFVGNNKAYRAHDFESKVSGPAFDATGPVNNSPNNAGARILPPAQPAFIWYPYGPSEEFPELGEGGRNAMAGPVYYVDDYADSDRKFPRYYDGKLFIYDWMRDWIMVVTMNEEGDYVAMERFMPNTAFHAPVDMLFGEDGALYMLEYGKTWYTQNEDARLVRIEYAVHNRGPIAQITADHPYGASPLTVTLSGAASRDPDGDEVTYLWQRGAEETHHGEEAVFTFSSPGTYRIDLTVTDTDGLTAMDSMDILVGNDVPEVSIDIVGNRTFFWEGRSLDYHVRVSDREDGSLGMSIDSSRVVVTMDYLAQGKDIALQVYGHQAALEQASRMVGKSLIGNSDCAACHQEEAASIGPSYEAIASKYPNTEESRAYLAEKIIQGGGGVWGTQAMAAHPQLSEEVVDQMASYILSLGADIRGLPLRGKLPTDAHAPGEEDGRYFLIASYTDRGAFNLPQLTGRDVLILRHPRLQAEKFDVAEEVQTVTIAEDTTIITGGSGSYLAFHGLDLTGVHSFSAQVGSGEETTGGRVDIRLDAPDGQVIGSYMLLADKEGLYQVDVQINDIEGTHDLYLVFVGDAEGIVCAIDWIQAQL